jgi:hypothetical protein
MEFWLLVGVLGLGNELIEGPTLEVRGRVQCRERLGGVLKYYYRKAA